MLTIKNVLEEGGVDIRLITHEKSIDIPEKIIRKHNIYPTILNEKDILIQSESKSLEIIQDIKLLTDMNIIFNTGTKEEILKKINLYYENKQNDEDENYVSKLLKDIINTAIKLKASDIHIEPISEYFRVRIRKDGVLQEINRYSIKYHESILILVKLKSNMDMSEKRVPQDGRFTYKFNQEDVDLRISSIPTVRGEKLVIRLLSKQTLQISKSNLGLTDKAIRMIDNMIYKSCGLILICGATGSGKTTTVYSILEQLKNSNKNITTIENPVEYMIDEINQIEVNVKSGLSFNQGLRSILRQDPDVIMVGEIRDYDTAKIAIEASNTGHLVISTIHANDGLSALRRLIDMGIDSKLIYSSVIGLVSQRLVRRTCMSCNNEEILKYTCKLCDSQGFKGRIGVFELIKPNNIHLSELNMIESKLIPNDDVSIITFKESCEYLIDNNLTTYDECRSIIDDDYLKEASCYE